MSLFVCDNCGCVENTALTGCSWIEKSLGNPMLCSACCPNNFLSNPFEWHNRFERKKWDGKEKVINRSEYDAKENGIPMSSMQEDRKKEERETKIL